MQNSKAKEAITEIEKEQEFQSTHQENKVREKKQQKESKKEQENKGKRKNSNEGQLTWNECDYSGIPLHCNNCGVQCKNRRLSEQAQTDE